MSRHRIRSGAWIVTAVPAILGLAIGCERPPFWPPPPDTRPLAYDGRPPSAWVARLADRAHEPWAALTAVGALAAAVREKDAPPDPRPREIRPDEEDREYQRQLPYGLRTEPSERLVGRATEADRVVLDDARPRLLELAADPRDELRAQSLCVLGSLGPRDEAERAAVRRGLADAAHHVRVCALHAAGTSSGAGDSMVQMVRGNLGDRDPEVRGAAVGALAGLAPGDARFVTDFGAALDDLEVSVRIKAARALARIGPAARSTTSKLEVRRDKAKTPTEQWEMRRALEAIAARPE